MGHGKEGRGRKEGRRERQKTPSSNRRFKQASSKALLFSIVYELDPPLQPAPHKRYLYVTYTKSGR